VTGEDAFADLPWRSAGGILEIALAQRAASAAWFGGFWSAPASTAGAAWGAPIEIGRWRVAEPTPVPEIVCRLVGVPLPADATWVTPGEALARWRRSEWLLPPWITAALAALSDSGVGSPARELRAASAPRAWEVAPALAVCAVRTPTLPPATHTNCYLVGDRELIAIDPASRDADERAALDAVIDALAASGRRVREIWLTHHHGDHVGGAAHLAARLSVPIAAHPETAARLVGSLHVDRTIADGEVVELPGAPVRRLRAVWTPGHAPGHLCLLDEPSRLLIAGDMVAGVGTIIIDPDDGDMRSYLASLARMRALAPRALLPAHGLPIEAATAKLDEYVTHRLDRERRVREALVARGRASAVELLPEVYADVAPALYPLAERSLLAHLIKLAADGRAERDGDGWVAVEQG
jgi:glyoxylase-like metal-dependent hydrolase (beta-lactamase superfamily II)